MDTPKTPWLIRKWRSLQRYIMFSRMFGRHSYVAKTEWALLTGLPLTPRNRIPVLDNVRAFAVAKVGETQVKEGEYRYVDIANALFPHVSTVIAAAKAMKDDGYTDNVVWFNIFVFGAYIHSGANADLDIPEAFKEALDE